MEKTGLVVVYFLGVDVQPPLSAVHIFPSQHVRPMAAGHALKEKTFCYARVGDQGYQCVVLAVDYESSMETLWEEVFRRRKSDYEDAGKRWAAEIKLRSTTSATNRANLVHSLAMESTRRVSAADESEESVGSSSHQIIADQVRMFKLGNQTLDAPIVFHRSANGSGATYRAQSPAKAPPMSSRNPNTFTTSTAEKTKFDAPSIYCGPGETVKTRPRKKAMTEAGTTSGKPFPTTTQHVGGPLAHSRRSSSSDENPDSNSESDPNSEQCRGSSVSSMGTVEDTSRVSGHGAESTSKAVWIFPQTVQMAGSFSKRAIDRNRVASVKDCRIPKRVHSTVTNDWIETRLLMEGMIKHKSWRFAVKYVASKLFTKFEIDNYAATAKRAKRLGVPMFAQENLKAIAGLTGLYCNETNSEVPSVAMIFDHITQVKTKNRKRKRSEKE